MYKSAKDLLGQYPSKMATGGDVKVDAWEAPSVGKAGTTPSGTTGPVEFAPVEAKRTQLKALNELPVSPLALSPSQQFARDRAAKQELVDAAIATAAAPLTAAERRALLQQVYKGDVTQENVQEKVINPLYEQRVRNAFTAIGRSGTTVMPGTGQSWMAPGGYKAPTTEQEYWLNQLKAGNITGAEFEKKFLTAAAEAPKWSTSFQSALDSANKARAALGMTLLKESDLPGYKAPPPVYSYGGFGTSYNIYGQPINNNLYNLMVPLVAKAATPEATIQPIDFSKPSSTQLFAEGGEVDKEESGVTLSKKELLDMLIEKQALQDLIANTPSVSVDPFAVAGTFGDKNVKGNYYNVGADLNIGDKLGIGASGRGSSAKFSGGRSDENVLSQLRGRYVTDGGIEYSGEYSPSAMPGQTDPTQRAYRLSRRDLNNQSEWSLAHEPGRMGMDVPGQAPEPGTTDTTWLRYAKQFAEGGDVKKSTDELLAEQVARLGLGPLTTEGAYELYKEKVPMHNRMYLQTLLGDRSKPFTEKDLTDKELDLLGDVVGTTKEARKAYLDELDRLRQDKRATLGAGEEKYRKTLEKEYAQTKSQVDKGSGNVQYTDYTRAALSGNDPYGEDDVKYYPAWNALGRYVYSTTPKGDVKIKDVYDFYNEQRAADVEKYEKMGPARKALSMIPAAWESIKQGKLRPIASEVGMAYIGRDGRPVDITIPGAAVRGPRAKNKK